MRYRQLNILSKIVYVIFLVTFIYVAYRWYPFIGSNLCPLPILNVYLNVAIALGVLAILVDFLAPYVARHDYVTQSLNSSVNDGEQRKIVNERIDLKGNETIIFDANTPYYIDGKKYSSIIMLTASKDTDIIVRKFNGNIKNHLA